MSDRIVDWAPHGQHIPLRCSNCGTTGSTKNISYIGARTVFVPCDCPWSHLEVIVPPNVAELLEQDRLERQEASNFLVFKQNHPKYESLGNLWTRLKTEDRNTFDEVKRILHENDIAIQADWNREKNNANS